MDIKTPESVRGVGRNSTSDNVSTRKDATREDASFPMYVMRENDLLSFPAEEGIPSHEEALEMGKIFEVVEDPLRKGDFIVYTVNTGRKRGTPLTRPGTRFVELRFTRSDFRSISHQWIRPSRDPKQAHPDYADHRKFKALQACIRDRGAEQLDKFIWMDYFSVPQAEDEESKQLQKDALDSIGCYFLAASGLFIISDEKKLKDISEGYLSRGICLMELATSKLPRVDMYGKWYIPGFEEKGQWGQAQALLLCTDSQNQCIGYKIEDLDWSFYNLAGNPVRGNFTHQPDREEIKKLLISYTKKFEDFYTEYLEPIRKCTTWDEVAMLPSELRPQIWTAERVFSNPVEFVDNYLPQSYILTLRGGLNEYESGLSLSESFEKCTLSEEV